MAQTGPGDKPIKQRNPVVRAPKVKKPKATVVKAPAGDIASSGGDYGMREAKRAERSAPVKRAQRAVYADQPIARRRQIVKNATGAVGENVRHEHASRIAGNRTYAKAQAGKDTKGDADRARAQAYLAAHPEILHPPKPQPNKKGSLIGTITAGAKLGQDLAAVVPSPVTAAAVVNKVTHGGVVKTLKNVPKDTAETVVSTPTSLVKLGDTAIHHPAKVPGMLAAPYVELAKHPLKTIEQHPVQTALMVAPAGKLPGRVVGKGLRVAGKQTLERTAAELPGTALKETRPASRDAIVNAVQKRADRKKPTPTMSDKQIQRRVDEFYDYNTQKHAQAQASAAREGKKRFAALPKAERKQKTAEHVEGVRKAAPKITARRFAKEFGSTWHVDPKTGAVIKPKAATEGHIHATRAEAELVKEKLNKRASTPFVVRTVAKDQYAVVPQVAKERLYGSPVRNGPQGHTSVGSGGQVMARVMRTSRHALTNAVLPTSMRWLGGQAGEAGLRAVVAGAGPMDLLRVHKIVKEMNKAQKGAGDEFLMRISGGQFGLTGTAREFAVGKRSLAEEFANTGLEKPAKAASAVGRTPPAKALKGGWGKYTHAVLGEVNGIIENTARKAMAGQAIKDSSLMERSIIGLSDKAIEDAAKGLRGTESQVQLARAVDRMYGKYQKFSPEMRSNLLHWTPFLPWYLNAAQFLFKVLPADHPLHSALIADTNAATEEWRKKNHMSLLDPAHRPAWMLGGYPTKKGVIPVGSFTPFGAGTNPVGATADLVLPGLTGPLKNAAGVDWKWQRLKYPGYKGREFTPSEDVVRALVTAVESHVPLAGQAGRLSGVTPKYVDHKQNVDSAGTVAKKIANPLTPVKATAPKKQAHKKRKGGTGDILGGRSAGTSDILK